MALIIFNFFQSLAGMIILIVASACIGYVVIPRIFSAIKTLKQKPPTIKRYWYFVIPFFILLITSYMVLLNFYFQDQKLNLYTDILNQISALIFAIFIGYFSFLQVIQNRADKLKQEGTHYLNPRNRDYARAIKTFEEIVSIEPNDFHNIANLLEAYLIKKDFKSFETHRNHFKKCLFSDKDELVYQYVMILYYFLRGHNVDADRHIAELVDFTRKNPEVTINWNFGDFTSSPTYTDSLEAGTDVRLKFDNVLSYLNKNMSAENVVRFESGDYTLRVPTPTV